MPTKTYEPIIHRLPDDTDLLDLHRLAPEHYPHLLQTTATPFNSESFDIVFAYPGQTLLLNARGLFLQSADRTLPIDGSFTNHLDELWQQSYAAVKRKIALPFYGGWFTYLGYELVRQIEPKLKPALKLPDAIPTAFATRFHAALIKCHKNKATYIVVEPEQAVLLEKIQQDIQSLSTYKPALNTANSHFTLQEDPADSYLKGIERIKKYIREGDIFQANLSRQWQCAIKDIDIPDLYTQLTRTNPAPYSGLVTFGDFAILSSSPERLFSVYDNIIETRPIAGTYPRGSDDTVDQLYRTQLLKHPKERAEHIMLIDLERNDLGRICQPGTIKVTELMSVESYAHVHHIVSNVQGCLQDNVTPGAIINAVFPGGTITGCPKVRCMEILSELEPEPRGPYTGSVGYLNRDGSADMNILIRSIVKNGERLSIRTGAGIVADSDPNKELIETRNKAKGVLKAFGDHAMEWSDAHSS